MMTVNVVDAADIDSQALRPAGELESSNHLLDDHAALMLSYEENGYLLFRGVLDARSVAEARRAMMDVMVAHGVIAPGAEEPLWTGVTLQGGLEESAEFAGIARRLLERPENMRVLEKILGEAVSLVPIVQYRSYPPGTSAGGVHQDGFFSPGIEGYKPVWIPLTDIDETVGGLLLAVGQHRRGFFHNLAKPPRFPVADIIPPESWRTTHYRPGDVLVVHPSTPHTGMANRSNRVRLSIDTRVQSAADPRILLGTVRSVAPGRVDLEVEGGRLLALIVDDETFLRIGDHPGTRLPLAELTRAARPGMRLVASFNGDRAVTLRRAAEG